MFDSGRGTVYRGSLEKLMAKVNAARGIDLTSYRRSYVERRVGARLRQLEMHSYRQYTDYLDEHPGEYQRLLDTLTINVTEFFRDQVVWDSLKLRVIKPMIEYKKQGRSRTIRIWSAGCASGEEPYSLVMLLLDVLGDAASQFLITVLATDLDPDALAHAERGVYDLEKLKRIPTSYKSRFTRPIDDERFEVLPEIRRRVHFQQRNLFGPTPQRAVDLVMCRNVFIYLDRDEQAKVLDTFIEALTRGGHLVLGRSEKLSPEAAALLAPIDGRERIYRKPLRP